MPTESDPVPQSFLQFVLRSLGFTYGPMLMIAGVVCFMLVLVLVIRGKSSFVTGALVLIVPIPLLLGIVGAIESLMSTHMRLAMSSVTPHPSGLAHGISVALVAPWFGFMMMMPAYTVAVIGCVIRCFLNVPQRRELSSESANATIP